MSLHKSEHQVLTLLKEEFHTTAYKLLVQYLNIRLQSNYDRSDSLPENEFSRYQGEVKFIRQLLKQLDRP